MNPFWRRPAAGPLAVAIVATVAVLATLAPEGNGPGVACDEWYHVYTGKRLVSALRGQGLSFFHAESIRRNFPWRPDGPPVHPPLGNWLLGLTHHLLDSAPDNPAAISILSARFAPALAFGLLVFLVGLYGNRTEGRLAGTLASLATALMPRVFGHAHLAALDTMTALMFIAAAVSLTWAAEAKARLWAVALAGLVCGLAMLTRLHGVLLLPPAVVWLAFRFGRKAAAPIAVWLLSGVATLFVGWPWLWLAPWQHLRQYLGTSTARSVIHVFYLGQSWADREVPRHYAVVMFLVTVPLGLLLLGACGLWARRRLSASPPGHLLIAGCFAFLLVVFSLPGTPVYDGVRLFLMLFPLWAIAVGVGGKWLAAHRLWRRRAAWAGPLAASALVMLHVASIVGYHPFCLSYYSPLAGGLWGAEKLGFEVTYWGEAVGEPLLAEAASRAPGGPLLFAPTLAPFQAAGVNASSPALLDAHVEIVGKVEELRVGIREIGYAVVYRRRADGALVDSILETGDVLAESSRQGVWLSRLVRIDLRTTGQNRGSDRPR